MGGSYQVPPVEIQHSDLALYVISPEAQNEKGLLSVVFFYRTAVGNFTRSRVILQFREADNRIKL